MLSVMVGPSEPLTWVSSALRYLTLMPQYSHIYGTFFIRVVNLVVNLLPPHAVFPYVALVAPGATGPPQYRVFVVREQMKMNTTST